MTVGDPSLGTKVSAPWLRSLRCPRRRSFSTRANWYACLGARALWSDPYLSGRNAPFGLISTRCCMPSVRKDSISPSSAANGLDSANLQWPNGVTHFICTADGDKTKTSDGNRPKCISHRNSVKVLDSLLRVDAVIQQF